jgi:hypothetical protein
MHRNVVILSDKTNVNEFSQTILRTPSLSDKQKQPFEFAMQVLTQDYEEEVHLSTGQIKNIYDTLRIDDNMTPEDMASLLKSDDHVAVLQKRYITASVNRKSFKIMLGEIVSQFKNILSYNVIQAIVEFVDNFSYLCLTKEAIHLTYRDLCFKFFTTDPRTKDLLVLILNIDYGKLVYVPFKCAPFCKWKENKLDMSFFGAVVKTDFPTLEQ